LFPLFGEPLVGTRVGRLETVDEGREGVQKHHLFKEECFIITRQKTSVSIGGGLSRHQTGMGRDHT
jgi:hypothetical protein